MTGLQAVAHRRDDATCKPLAIVLAPHEPSLDPRVGYVCGSLAKMYSLVLVSVVQEFDVRPEENFNTSEYEVVRVPFHHVGAFRQLCSFLRYWWNVDSVQGKLIAIVLCPAAVPLIVAAVLGLFAYRSVRRAAGALWRKLVRPVLRPLWYRSGLVRETVVNYYAKKSALVQSQEGKDRNAVAPGERSWMARTAGKLREEMSGFRNLLSIARFTLEANHLLSGNIPGSGNSETLIYCHDLYCLQTGVALKQRMNARLIYDSHEYFPYQYQSRLFEMVVDFYERVLLSAVDVYITVSPQLAAELESRYHYRPVHVIPNVEPLPAEQEVPRTQMSETASGRLKVLYQGTFAEGRGLEEVLLEWTQVESGKAVLFLRGPQNIWRDRLELMARTYGMLGRSVYVLEPVLEKDLTRAASEADIGLIPYKLDWLSYRYACPNKLCQYLHAGLAIVANQIPFVEQIVNQNRCGFSYDIRIRGDLTKLIDRVTSEPELLKNARANARKFSVETYRWENYEKTLMQLAAPP
jgi:glycosyltransferase involved in cell wall biosynthesis